jgi:hypothetical protein
LTHLRILIAAATIAALTGTASAALSGYWETSKTLHAILGRNGVADALKQQPIESITATETGYRIKSRDCTVDVRVDRKQSSKPGPSGFRIHVGHARCH